MTSLEDVFPRLRTSAYEFTSPQDVRYNCVAWAAGDVDRWWEPDGFGLGFWPAIAPRAYTLEAYASAYSQLGFEKCRSQGPEAGFEKIAIFVDEGGKPEHVARQLYSGSWTSKLGQSEDIEHELDALEGEEYGRVGLIMKRLRPPAAKKR